MKRVLLALAFVSCACPSFAVEKPIDIADELFISNGEVFDHNGSRYVNAGSYWNKNIEGYIEKQNCIPLAILIDPNADPKAFDNYEVLDHPSCKIKMIGDDDNHYVPIETDTEVVDAMERTLTASCTDYPGYAPPNFWSPEIAGPGHIGAASFKISVKWYGDTYVSSRVRYWAPSNRWQKKVFNAQTRIRTGHAAASIYMSYKGIPLGSSVKTTIC